MGAAAGPLAGACSRWIAGIGPLTAAVAKSARRTVQWRFLKPSVSVCMSSYPWPEAVAPPSKRQKPVFQKSQLLFRPVLALLPAGEAAPLETQPQVFNEREAVGFTFQHRIGRAIRKLHGVGPVWLLIPHVRLVFRVSTNLSGNCIPILRNCVLPIVEEFFQTPISRDLERIGPENQPRGAADAAAIHGVEGGCDPSRSTFPTSSRNAREESGITRPFRSASVSTLCSSFVQGL